MNTTIPDDAHSCDMCGKPVPEWTTTPRCPMCAWRIGGPPPLERTRRNRKRPPPTTPKGEVPLDPRV